MQDKEIVEVLHRLINNLPIHDKAKEQLHSDLEAVVTNTETDVEESKDE